MDHSKENPHGNGLSKYGKVYEKGKRLKKWYGQFCLYMRDREGKEVERTRKVILGLKSELSVNIRRRRSFRTSSEKENGKIGLAVPRLLLRMIR